MFEDAGVVGDLSVVGAGAYLVRAREFLDDMVPAVYWYEMRGFKAQG
jgi:hypothetical protein